MRATPMFVELGGGLRSGRPTLNACLKQAGVHRVVIGTAGV